MKRRMHSKALSLLLAAAMLLTLAPAELAADYVDMPTDWAHDAVQAGVDAGLIVPDGEGKLNPTKALTRAEVADIMVRAFGSGGKADLSSFRDIPADHPYREALASAVYMGLMSGGGGKMSPHDAGNREQAFVILNNSLKVGSDPGAVAKFADAGKVSDWAKGACGALVAKGYVSGSGSNLNPQNKVTKQELLQILYNIFGTNYVRTAGTYTTSTDKSLVVTASGAALSGLTVGGDLVIGDGAGLVTLDSVTVKGRVVARSAGSATLLNCNAERVVSVNDAAAVSVKSTGGVRTLDVSGGEDGLELNPARRIALDYMRAESALKWTPDRDIVNDNSTVATFEKGVVYTGMPYGNDVDASMMEFLSFVDENNVYHGPDGHEIKGVDCSSSITAAWCQVASSVDYTWTWQVLPYSKYRGSQGSIPVGDYVMPEKGEIASNATWEEARTHTLLVIDMNGPQVMCESYAKLQPADGLVMYKMAGHTRMVSKPPVVVRKADGTIDPRQSYVTTIEITNPWFRDKDADGNNILTCWKVDYQYTFQNLMDDGYIPITCPELVSGEIPAAEVSLDSKQDVTGNKGLIGMISSNYRLFRVKAVVTDASGKEISKAETFPLNMVDLTMASNYCNLSVLNGDLKIGSLPAGTYMLTLTVNVGTEERTVLTQAFQI